MKKRLLAAVVTGVLLTGALAGCGSTAKTETKDDANAEQQASLSLLQLQHQKHLIQKSLSRLRQLLLKKAMTYR